MNKTDVAEFIEGRGLIKVNSLQLAGMYIPVHLMSKSDLEQEISALTDKRDLLKKREKKRLIALKIELTHRISKLPRSAKYLIVQGGVCGSTKK